MPLPQELMDYEILCRLPVKSLLRFRRVSKQWCSLIDSIAFVKIHLQKTIECNTYGGVIFTGGDQSYLADLESLHADDVHVKEIDDPLKTLLSGAQFIGAANGLLCFCKDNRNEFILFNPSTRKYKTIPSLPSEFASSFDGVGVSPCGFGYDHVNDDYKVVKIAEFSCKMVMVYSLKSNYWTKIQNVPSNIYLSTEVGLITRGTLHWYRKKKHVLVGFDLGLERFEQLSFPVDDNGILYIPIYGSLCAMNSIFSTDVWHWSTEVWLINNYGTQNPWYKAFSAELPIEPEFYMFRPVAFSRSGKEVLLQVKDSGLAWYDLESKVVKNVRIHGIPIEFSSHVYTESLFPG